jgi:hypothetical protein
MPKPASLVTPDPLSVEHFACGHRSLVREIFRRGVRVHLLSFRYTIDVEPHL